MRIAELTASLERTRRYQKLRRDRDRLRSRLANLDPGSSRLVGGSSVIARAMDLVDRVAATDRTTLLITGDSGAGKELVARAIHDRSRRVSEAFVSLNCTAVPDALFESELFGHEKGAFTDAEARKPGMFELASGGTLFLDEIADMSSASQAKILRVLEERTLLRVGGVHEIPVDVRLVAATNRDLESMQRDGHFRQDLFFRLNVFTIHLPPCANVVMTFCCWPSISSSASQSSSEKTCVAWMRRRAICCAAMLFLATCANYATWWSAESSLLTARELSDLTVAAAPAPLGEHLELASLEERAIRSAFDKTENNQAETARLLGIGVDALRYRLRKFGRR